MAISDRRRASVNGRIRSVLEHPTFLTAHQQSCLRPSRTRSYCDAETRRLKSLTGEYGAREKPQEAMERLGLGGTKERIEKLEQLEQLK